MRSEIEMQAENDEHYRKAKKAKAQPYIAKTDGDEGVFKMPFLGVYLPKGWESIAVHFVDSSGWGSENEPALTVKKFLKLVKKGNGYSLRSAGQFQVYVNEFKKAVVK
jgi:hypothetical protein